MWEEFVIRAALGIVAACVKNPVKKAQLKEVLLDVRDAITDLYPEGHGVVQ